MSFVNHLTWERTLKNLKMSLALLVVLALAVAAVASGALTRSKHSGQGAMAGMNMNMNMTHSTGAASSKAVALRVALNELLGEHAILAIQATQRGLVGGKDFAAVAKQLDANSVAISKAIGIGLRHRCRQAVPERQEPVARTHQRLRRVHRRNREARQGRTEEGRQRTPDLRSGAGRLLRQGDRTAEAGARQRPDRARLAAQGPAGRVRGRATTRRRTPSPTPRTTTWA